MGAIELTFILSLTIFCCYAVDRNNFKTCEQSGFCKRLRNFKPEKSLYVLNTESIKVLDNALLAEVYTTHPDIESKIEV